MSTPRARLTASVRLRAGLVAITSAIRLLPALSALLSPISAFAQGEAVLASELVTFSTAVREALAPGTGEVLALGQGEVPALGQGEVPAQRAGAAVTPDVAQATPAMQWWLWSLILFFVCITLGMVAVPAGVGGGVLFVPIVSGFFPFHLDFVRGAGLLVALASALAAGPSLLRAGFAQLRLGVPLALLASLSSIFGAMLGLALPAPVVQTALGVTILGIVVLMASARSTEGTLVRPDGLALALGMHGMFIDPALRTRVRWRVHRTAAGAAVFTAIGVLAGMFGLGAGWANVPTLNLLMGAPLKVSAGTSSFILSLVDTSAAWVYLNRGAVLPAIAVPAVLGMMLGARVGVHFLRVLPARTIRRFVIVLLLLAGLRSLAKGLGLA